MSVPNQPPQQGRNTPMAAPLQEFAPYQGGAPQGTNTYPGGVPYQGYPQAFAVGPYAQLPPRVNKLSVGLGIAGWVIIGLTVLLMWLSILATESDPDPSGKEVIGFYPLFASIFLMPVNLVGGVTGLVRALDKMTKWKLNWLGIVLNASPHVIFIAFMLVLPLIPS